MNEWNGVTGSYIYFSGDVWGCVWVCGDDDDDDDDTHGENTLNFLSQITTTYTHTHSRK